LRAAPGKEEDGRASRKVVLTQELKEKIDGKESQVVMLELTYSPGAGTPKHRHPAPVFVHLVEGTIESQIEGQPPKTYTQGGTFFEPAGAVHVVSRNASRDKPAKFLAVFLAEKGKKQFTTLVNYPRLKLEA
jgi:Uncharacterized conserved protein, contains double-stranded beta-helix domain